MQIIIATDELAGTNFDDNNNITVVSVKDGTMEQICEKLLDYLMTVKLKPCVILCAGTFNVTFDHLEKYKPLYLYGEWSSQDVIEQMVNDILKPANKVLQEVAKKEGKLVVCSLLPSLRNKISTSIFKQMLEEVYEKANLDLKRINLLDR